MVVFGSETFELGTGVKGIGIHFILTLSCDGMSFSRDLYTHGIISFPVQDIFFRLTDIVYDLGRLFTFLFLYLRHLKRLPEKGTRGK